jgi:hypothetical protein
MADAPAGGRRPAAVARRIEPAEEPSMKKTAVIVLVCLLLACPLLAHADRDEESDPQAIRKEIEKLRIFYTDDHPDIQILKRRLDRALQNKAKRDQEKALRQQQQEAAPAPAPRAAQP